MISPTSSEHWRAQLLQWAAPPPEDPPANAASTDGWRQFADRFRALNQTVRGREEPFFRFLTPWLGPEVSVMDVGAGGGRFTCPLAERVGQVTAVEPSEGMRTVLAEAVQERGLTNVEMVAGRWPDAQPSIASTDLVICSNVFYDVPDLAPFIQALDAAARRRVAIFLTLTHPVGAMSALWRQFRGWETPTGPTYLDAAQVAFALGIAVNVTLLPVEPTLVFPNWEAALAMYRLRLGLRPDASRDAELQSRLADMIDVGEDRLIVRPRERHAAVIWWDKS